VSGTPGVMAIFLGERNAPFVHCTDEAMTTFKS
jgi:hypothetical protein